MDPTQVKCDISDNTKMKIGGKLDNNKLAEMCMAIKEIYPRMSTTLLRSVLTAGTRISGHYFKGVYQQNKMLEFWYEGSGRMQKLEEFCTANNLSFIVYSKRSFTSQDAEIADHEIIQWEPGMEDLDYFTTDSKYHQMVDENVLKGILSASEMCHSLEVAPKLINHESNRIKTVSQRLLKGDDPLTILCSELRKCITPIITIPPFVLV